MSLETAYDNLLAEKHQLQATITRLQSEIDKITNLCKLDVYLAQEAEGRALETIAQQRKDLLTMSAVVLYYAQDTPILAGQITEAITIAARSIQEDKQ